MTPDTGGPWPARGRRPPPRRLPCRGAEIAAALAIVSPLAACGASSSEHALAQSLVAFARPARASDRWPERHDSFGIVRDSRLIARLNDPLRGRIWRLYLVQTTQRETCLELLDVGGDCNDTTSFFVQAPYELLNAGPIIAAVFAPTVQKVELRLPGGDVLPARLTPDHAILLGCPLTNGQISCHGDELVGAGTGGRRLFTVAL